MALDEQDLVEVQQRIAEGQLPPQAAGVGEKDEPAPRRFSSQSPGWPPEARRDPFRSRRAVAAESRRPPSPFSDRPRARLRDEARRRPGRGRRRSTSDGSRNVSFAKRSKRTSVGHVVAGGSRTGSPTRPAGPREPGRPGTPASRQAPPIPSGEAPWSARPGRRPGRRPFRLPWPPGKHFPPAALCGIQAGQQLAAADGNGRAGPGRGSRPRREELPGRSPATARTASPSRFTLALARPTAGHRPRLPGGPARPVRPPATRRRSPTQIRSSPGQHSR